jgi:WD40 repeat protein
MSGSFDGTLSLMEIGRDHIVSSKLIGSFSHHKDKVLQAQWHPTRPNILSSGADKIVKYWSF